MKYFSLAFALAVAGLTGTFLYQEFNQAALAMDPNSDWELIAEFHRDRFVIDSGLTLVECLDSAPRHDPAHEFYTACERPE